MPSMCASLALALLHLASDQITTRFQFTPNAPQRGSLSESSPIHVNTENSFNYTAAVIFNIQFVQIGAEDLKKVRRCLLMRCWKWQSARLARMMA